MLAQKVEGRPLSLGHSDPTLGNPRNQAVSSMMADIPFIHLGQFSLTDIDGKTRPLGDDRKITFGHNRRNLNNRVLIRVEPRHLEINPDQPLLDHDPTQRRPAIAITQFECAGGRDCDVGSSGHCDYPFEVCSGGVVLRS